MSQGHILSKYVSLVPVQVCESEAMTLSGMEKSWLQAGCAFIGVLKDVQSLDNSQSVDICEDLEVN